MNKKIKKNLSLLIAVFTVFSVFTIGLTAYGEDNVAINEFNFPDATFRNVIKSEFDTDGNGYLSVEERQVPFMSLSGMIDYNEEIVSIQGIEFFADSLSNLYCGSLGLESLDVSALTNLTILSCPGNYLTSLDVSQNTSLYMLDCSNNALTSVNLGNNSNLRQLFCDINNLESIDVSGTPNITSLNCDQNRLVSLNVSGLSQLSSLNCAYNRLLSLDLSANTNLAGISDYQISNQIVSSQAVISNNSILVPAAAADPSRIYNSTFGTGETAVYSNNGFTADDVSKIDSGISYIYSVGNSNCEDMEVTILPSRNFAQVNFYDGADMANLIGKSFVNYGQAATAPQVTPDVCKSFDGWNEDISNITTDKSVYALWSDAHSYALTSFDNYVAQITCSGCQDSFTVNFKDCINKAQGEQGYYECLDVVNDGVINAKDYAQLIKNY